MGLLALLKKVAFAFWITQEVVKIQWMDITAKGFFLKKKKKKSTDAKASQSNWSHAESVQEKKRS